METNAYRMSHSSLGSQKLKKSLHVLERKDTKSFVEIRASDAENIFEFSQPFASVQEEENTTLYKHNLHAIDESYETVSDDGRRTTSVKVSSDSVVRLEIMKLHKFRRYSAPEIRVDLNRNDPPIKTGTESLCGSNISSFYNLWNRPKSPQILGRGSLQIPKALKLSGQFRDCGCPTREERGTHRECKGNLSKERHHHSL